MRTIWRSCARLGVCTRVSAAEERALPLCRFHHRQVHEGGVTIQKLSDGALRFTFKDGRSLDSLQPLRSAQSAFEAGLRPDDALQSAQNAENTPTAPQADWTDLFATHKAMDIVIDSKTAVTLWTGEHMDYSTATGALLYLARGCKPPTFIPNVSAETPTQSTPEHVSAETPDHSRAQCQ